MKREIGKLRRHYIICGYGRVGRQVAEVLEEADLDVVIIDNHPGAAEDLDARNGLYVIGSATDDDVLRQAGIEQAKGLCSCLPQDADNVFVVLSARALNPELTIISRSNLAESAAKLRMAGANQIINPYLITGRRMAAQLVHPTVVEFLDVVMQRGDLELRIEELIIGSGSNMAGKTMAECHVRSETGVNVLAVRRADGTTYTDMGADFVFQAGDSLISLGTPHQLALLAERAADRRQWTRIAKRLTGQPPK